MDENARVFWKELTFGLCVQSGAACQHHEQWALFQAAVSRSNEELYVLMEEVEDTRILEDAKAKLQSHLVGFLNLSTRAGAEDAVSAGSGTLVDLGPARCILTAAHVVEALPESGDIGLLRFSGPASIQQRMKLRMEYVDRMILGSPPFDDSGPDLALLKLPLEDVYRLESLGCVFHNVASRMDDVLAHRYLTETGFCCATGVIEEGHVPSRGVARR